MQIIDLKVIDGQSTIMTNEQEIKDLIYALHFTLNHKNPGAGGEEMIKRLGKLLFELNQDYVRKFHPELIKYIDK